MQIQLRGAASCKERAAWHTAAILALLTLVGLVSPALASAAGEACPNEQLRVEDHSTSLPNCRSYEMVTPPLKNGQIVAEGHAALDGESLAFQSLGAFGEAGDSQDGAGLPYIASRHSDGWASIPRAPSAAQFQSEFSLAIGLNEDLSGDLEENLQLLSQRFANREDYRFYRRSADGKNFIEVGPVVSPARLAEWQQGVAETGLEGHFVNYDGATRDLSHIFFAIHPGSGEGKSWFWPGDPTNTVSKRDSLYEYVGTGNSEPELVGVAPGETKDKPSQHPKLVSRCGTAIGGQEGSNAQQGDSIPETYNAISTQPSSEEGRTVFFTASNCFESPGEPPVDELYARIAGTTTVAISEPTTVDCADCVNSVPEKGLFQGASADGTRVFFLSDQSLFGGAENEEDDNLYEYDFNGEAGHKVTLVAPRMGIEGEADPGGVVRVTEDGSRVYFVSGAVLPGAEANEFGVEPKSEARNLYVYDTQTKRYTFVALLTSNDSNDWNESDSRTAEATPDGRFLIFKSTGDLTPDASGEGSQIYRYDAEPTASEMQEGVPQLTRISIGDAQSDDGNRGASSFFPSSLYEQAARSRPQPVAISSDGAEVFFESFAALTPQALDDACTFEEQGSCSERNMALNIYEWDDGHVYLLSDGQDVLPNISGEGTDVGLIGASSDGRDVFFTTGDELVGQDGDSGVDIYDARADGGFPAPASVAACEGEACKASLPTPPALATAASATFSGVGNIAPTPKPPSKLTAAQVKARKLAAALRACKRKHNRHARSVCQSAARRRYGPKARKSAHANQEGHR